MRHETKVDPLLTHLLGDARDDDRTIGLDPRDAIGDFLFHQRYGIDADGAKPRPLTIPEIAKALNALRASLRDSPTAERQTFLERMAIAAEEYCPENSFVCRFFKAAAEGDDLGMKAAVHDFVEQNRDSILDLDKHLSEPTSEIGEPNSTVKRGNWTFSYDAGGALEKVFEGDTEPFFN